jgi:hypothetical protein
MTQNVYSYNYTYCNTTQTGTYIVNGCSNLGCWNYNFEVNALGTNLTNSQALLYILMFFIAFLFFVIFIATGIFLPYKNKKDDSSYHFGE